MSSVKKETSSINICWPVYISTRLILDFSRIYIRSFYCTYCVLVESDQY